MNTFKQLTVIALALLLAACAAGMGEQRSIEERLAERGYLIGPGDQRIPRYRINSWQEVDDRHLIVRSGVRDHYLVELFAPCLELDYAFTVGFSTPTSRVDRFADLIVRGLGGRGERCSIRDIYMLSDVDTDAQQGAS